jgi:AGCS family alanine or glycine:cation symporter
VVVTVATGIIIFGGVRRIARFAELVVPFMALAYLAVGLAVLIMNFSALPETLALIVKSAFGPQELAGGVAGYAWASALSQGVNRGLFSNEAGLGSAPNAAATADIRHPASQGYVQAVGVFIDTIVVCTVTAMIILLSNPWSSIDENSEGVKLTQDSLSNEVGSWGAQFIAIALIFFTFTSIVACYYYGETSLLFMKDDHRLVTVMRILVMAIVAWGAVAKAQLVWDISNVALGLMALVNLVALLLLSRKGFAVIRDYEKQAKSGIDPQFHRDDFPDLDNHIEPDVWVPDRAEPKPA